MRGHAIIALENPRDGIGAVLRGMGIHHADLEAIREHPMPCTGVRMLNPRKPALDAKSGDLGEMAQNRPSHISPCRRRSSR